MNKKLIPVAIDFEYNQSNEIHMGLVSCAICVKGETPKSYWLDSDSESQIKLKKYLLSLREDHFFICWNISAEARCFIALGLDPVKFTWYDAQIEYKMLTNWNDSINVGNHLSKTGKIVHLKKYSQVPLTLLAATYKLLGIIEDPAHKNKMRKLILSRKKFTPDEKRQIIDYGISDIKNLFEIIKKINDCYRKVLIIDELKLMPNEIFYRGKIGALTALIESRGYPIDQYFYGAVKNNAPSILRTCIEDINSQFDWPIFIWNKSKNDFSMAQKKIKEWIANSEYKDTWKTSAKGGYSLSEKAMAKLNLTKYNYPRGNVLAQVKRYNDLKKSFSGFLPKNATSDTGFFEDHLGSDGYVRPYLNCYGSQSARWQPKQVGYIFLKSPMFRSMVHPKPNQIIIGCDYVSQEIYIAALNSKDNVMMESYLSGDFYLDFGKKAKVIPQDGTKKSHSVERDRFKSTALGISYGMGAPSLAAKLKADTGIPHSEKEAQDLIDLYYLTYLKYAKYIKEVLSNYNSSRKMKLVDGWYMWGSNDNWRSVANCPVQGMGSSILRKVVERCYENKIKITMLLHDAAYFLIEKDELYQVDNIAVQMKEAFADCYPDMKEEARKIRLDFNAWGDSLTNGVLTSKDGYNIKTQKNYFDPRGVKEYELYLKKYVDKPQ